MTSKPFEYRRFLGSDEIRLILLRPSHDKSAPVECELVHKSLHSASGVYQEYEALSYCWGSEGLGSIKLNGRYFKVRPNLKAALLTLRHARDPRYLWVDAVCINQDDIDEVDREVLRMREIYEGATRVVVWLGNEDETTALAVNHLIYLNEQWRDRGSTDLSTRLSRVVSAVKRVAVLLGRPLLITVAFYLLFLGKWPWLSALFSAIYLANTHPRYVSDMMKRLDCPSNPVVVALNRLFERTWFTRVWVIQEIAVARDAVLICGAHSMPWEAFCGACRQISRLATETWARSCYLDSGFKRGYYLVSSLDLEGYPPALARRKRSLLFLLSWFNFFDASKVHDKAYALAGLASDFQDARAGGSAFKPRYELGVSKSYAEVARFIIENSGDLGIFGACMGNRSLPGLPSWVPDWSVSAIRETRGLILRRPYRLPTEPSTSTVTSRFSADLKILEVQGFTIGHVSGPLEERMSFIENPFLLQLAKVWMGPFARPLSKLFRSVALSSWLFSGSFWARAVDDFFDLEAELAELPGPSPEGPLPEWFPGTPKYYKFHWEPIDVIEDYKFLFGLFGNTWAQHIGCGDTMCIMLGADLPVVLRKDGRHWVIKGPCNFDEFGDRMLWQRMLDMHSEGKVQLQRFLIK